MPEENKGTNMIGSFFHNIFHKYDDEDDAEYDYLEEDEEDTPAVKAEKEEASSAGSEAEKKESTSTAPAVKADNPAPVVKAEKPVSPPAPAAKTADVGKPSAAAGKLGSIFGKFVEIITQPDDSEFFEADEDMDEILSSAGETEEDRKPGAAASSLYIEKPARKPEPQKAEAPKTERVIAEPIKAEMEKEEIKPTAAVRSVQEEKNEPAEAAEVSVKEVKTEEKSSPAQTVRKAEITLDEIMQIRQADVQRTPMTFRAPSVEVSAEEESPAAAEDIPTKPDTDKKPEETAPEDKPAEKTVKVRPVPIAGKKDQKPAVKVQKVAVKPASPEAAEKKTAVTEGNKPEEQNSAGLYSAKNEENLPQEETQLYSAKNEEKPPEDQTHTVLYSAKKEEKPSEDQTHAELFSAKETEKPEASEEAKAAVSVPAAANSAPKPVPVPAAAPTVKPIPAAVPVPTVPAAKAVPVPAVPTVKPAPVPAASAAKPIPVSVSSAKQQPAQTAKQPPAQRTVQSVYDDIKTTRRTPEPVRKPDLSEAKAEPIVYHGSEGIPFIVMAGKFSKTIKTQYEISRKYYLPAAAARPAVPKPAANGNSSEANKPEIKPAVEPELPKSPAPKIKKKPPIKMPKKKRSLGASISGLFSGDDEFDEDPNAEETPRPELEDYRSSDEADEIKSDINENLRNVFVRTVVLTATAAASIITALLAYFMPWLFTTAIHHGWLVYALVNLLLLGISVFFDRYPIYSGLVSLLHFKGDSDTAGAVAVVAVTIQTIFALFLPDVFVNGTYHIYVPLVNFALLLGSIGKLLIIKRTADNFRFLLRNDAVYAGKIYKNIDKAEEFVMGLPSRKPIIAYMKRSSFMSNFLHLSYAADPVEELCRMISPFTSYFALLCGIGYSAVTKDVVGGVSCFALSAVILIPMCGLLALNIPMKNLSGSTLKKGAMLAGYESVKQFADTNTIMLDYSQLYPKGSIILSGIKAFNENKIQEAILAGAAVTFSVGGSMSYIFETMIQDRRNMLPKVDSVDYDDNMGLKGWVEGKRRVLIGNRALLEYHNITPPDEKIEEKYRKMGNEIAYISIGGELVAMFILTYKADRKIAEALRDMEENGVSFLIRTIDPNITSKHIAEKFSLYGRCVKVLPTGLGTVCYDEISGKEKSSRAYMVTNGSIEAFAAAITGCIKMRSAVTISKIIQMLSIGIGFVLVNVIAFLSGFAKLGCFELLLYISFWCIALIAVSVIARKIA